MCWYLVTTEWMKRSEIKQRCHFKQYVWHIGEFQEYTEYKQNILLDDKKIWRSI